MRKILLVIAALVLVPVLGCGNGSKQDIVNKTANIKTKQELEKKLGKPDSFNKVGPLETWTYKASDGEVSYVITGDTVQMSAATGEKKN